MPAVEIERWEQIRLYVEDLAVLQQHSEQYFPIPIDLNVEDRIALRVARLLIDGHTVISPLHRVLTCTPNGNDSPSLRDALTQEPRGIRAATELTLTLAERTFNLGPAQFSHPRAAAVNARHATEALDTGDAEGTQIEFRPADGEHFRFHLLSSPEQQPLTPVPLGLPGYREPS